MYKNTFVIDSDAHVIEPPDLWVRYMDRRWFHHAPRRVVETQIPISFGGETIPPNDFGTGALFSPLKRERYKKAAAQNFSAAAYLEAMNEEGIDLSILFPTMGLLVMGAASVDPEITTAAARAYNNWLRDFCNEGERRLFGTGMLDLRNVKSACEEAVRCVEEHKFVALFARPNPVMGRQLYDPAYEPLWAVIEGLDVPVCFHEGNVVGLPQIGPDRFGDRVNLWHMTTHVMENQLAMVAMVLGGVLERHPRLRCGFMECGAGWLPYWMWRMNEHAETRFRLSGAEVDHKLQPAEYLRKQPSEYVRRNCYVSADTDEDTAVYAMQYLHGSNVLWASDYPHSDAKYPNAVRTVTSLPGIAPYLESVLCSNPAEFFGAPLRAAAIAGRMQLGTQVGRTGSPA